MEDLSNYEEYIADEIKLEEAEREEKLYREWFEEEQNCSDKTDFIWEIDDERNEGDY